MSDLAKRSGPASLAVNIASAVCFAAVGNGIIAMLGWRAHGVGEVSPSFAPPGVVIGAVWTMLFAAMGAARWLVMRDDTDEGRISGRLVTALIVACFTYPYYTLGFRSAQIGLIGSLATAAFCAFIVWRIAAQSRLAAALVSATLLWCLFASVVLLRTLQLNS